MVDITHQADISSNILAACRPATPLYREAERWQSGSSAQATNGELHAVGDDDVGVPVADITSTVDNARVHVRVEPIGPKSLRFSHTHVRKYAESMISPRDPGGFPATGHVHIMCTYAWLCIYALSH